jgi:hypothetical protein
VGTWGRGDVGTWGRGDVGTWGRGDVGTWGRGTWGRGDVGTWGRGALCVSLADIAALLQDGHLRPSLVVCYPRGATTPLHCVTLRYTGGSCKLTSHNSGRPRPPVARRVLDRGLLPVRAQPSPCDGRVPELVASFTTILFYYTATLDDYSSLLYCYTIRLYCTTILLFQRAPKPPTSPLPGLESAGGYGRGACTCHSRA